MSQYRIVKLGDVLEYEQPTKYIVSNSMYDNSYNTPVLTAGKTFLLGYTNETENIFTKTPVIIFDDFTTAIKFVDFPFKVKSSAMKILNPTDDIDIKYMFYLMSTIKSDKGLHKRYWISKYANIEINLPTLEKQKQIAKTLDKANELINLRKESITKLDALAKSIFIDMFGDPVCNSKKWEIKKLKQLTDVKTGKTPSRAEPSYWENGTELWATTTEVNKRFIFDTQEKVTKYAVEKCNLTVYPENTILIAMYGQGKTRGNVVLLKAKSTINQAFGAILSSENINQEFLLSLLKNSYSHIRSLGRGGNQENLNLDIVKNLDIISPPIAHQNKFAKIIEKIEEQKVLYTQELEKLQENFDALLQKSFQ